VSKVKQTVRRAINSKAIGSAMLDARDDTWVLHDRKTPFLYTRRQSRNGEKPHSCQFHPADVLQSIDLKTMNITGKVTVFYRAKKKTFVETICKLIH
jgi:hypothetical protein